MRPLVPHQDVRPEKSDGAKLLGQRNLTLGWSDIPRGNPATANAKAVGARVDGMANPGELLINVVRSNKPKALTGLNHKVSGQVQRDPPSPVVVDRATGG